MYHIKNNKIETLKNVKICFFTNNSILSKKFFILFSKLEFIYWKQMDFISISTVINENLSKQYRIPNNWIAIIVNWKIAFKWNWYPNIDVLEEKLKKLLKYSN